LKAGKGIKEAQDFCENAVWAVAVSRDGQWFFFAADSDRSRRELTQACKVETGIVKTFKGRSLRINCVDIHISGQHATGEWGR
jgi:hypothetical protein